MDCQLGCPLKSVNFTHLAGGDLDSACTALGQCLNVGRARRSKIADIVALQEHTVGLDWHIACKL
jgi:hypothetical protein